MGRLPMSSTAILQCFLALFISVNVSLSSSTPSSAQRTVLHTLNF
jgi:hypothetical protein